jgi:hypothetical protein
MFTALAFDFVKETPNPKKEGHNEYSVISYL